mmetsp:Transcript_1319/g.3859  ORF Transcript_1319/g.3859 Transcript_1319/m.3859 type:complete len:244 (-) Transcript_1319:697-1428(-)
MLLLHPRVADVHHLVLDVEVQIVATPQLVLESHKQAQNLRLGHLHEACQLGNGNGGVQAQVRAQLGQARLLLDLLHENAQLQLVRVLREVRLSVVVVGRRGRDELGARIGEKLVVATQLARCHALQLIGVLLHARLLHRLVHHAILRAQCRANRHQCIHLLVALDDLLVRGRLRVKLLGAADIQQDVVERLRRQRVLAPHNVREARVVVHADVAARDALVQRGARLRETQRRRGLQRAMVVAQ